jgi:ABC-type nitrate/sulfonate/bicarbonate transport system permease component
MMLLAQSRHFLLLFVALETLTIGLYILVGYFRTRTASLEAGLKYLLMGALSSGLLLFGIVLLYGVAGNPSLPGHTAQAMNYTELSRFLAANPDNFIASLGVVLVLAGVAFKIGAFPFQIWVPDVYQGAPTPVTAFLAVASKGAGFAVLLALCGPGGAFLPYSGLVTPVLTLMAAAEKLDPRLEEAARSLGASPFGVLRDVLLPGMAPALAAAGAICFATATGAFGTAFALASRIDVLPMVIYTEFTLQANLAVAAALSFLLGIATWAVLALARGASGGAAA